ncbi:prolyl oligopeptidase [Sphingomonas metalli]|uniref:Prolyl oligopeptidase n=1 Tax=Sphingomonas metalli TaxID=1779358 RepID=A0A916T796_9SPHN|nr:prolyl oligopeptidase family serine peptidase [Sphingomonas metalli]GGB34386.1 prolyl oligopeptidase [Sphingomonas metalli]
MRAKTRWLVAAAAILAGSGALAQTAAMTDDPYIWLEDKDGARPLAWVEGENARTLSRLQSDPRYATFYQQALAIASATDRIPMPEQTFGRIYNFWRDAEHPRGLWRWTSEADYASANPKWTVALDVDALGKAEGKQWVWHGATCLPPEERYCLVQLSEGGEDAESMREFDLQTGRFVPDGFALPKSKQGATWIDRDTLLVSRDWGQGTMTNSSYPFVVKMVKRGQPLAAATEVFRGAVTDQLGSYARTLTDAKGNRVVLIGRRQTFFGGDTLVWTPQGTKTLAIPPRAQPVGLVEGRVIFETSDPWGPIPAGAIAWVPVAEIQRGEANPRLLFKPTPRQAVQGVALTRDRVLVSYTDNVRGRVSIFAPGGAGWTSRDVPVADNMAVGFASTTDRSNTAYMTVTGFVTPTMLQTIDAAGTAAPRTVKALPARFDATGQVVEQFEATSTDGTRVPYFVVHRRDRPLDGSTPTIMTAYGGFEISRLPTYLGATGKLWLENGGAFVLANIRGGGEFGPAWHDAGRKTKRQVIYDDFASVARDLFARKITSAQKLGIYGGSNGGLLMGVEMTQQPDLWKAVSIGVPLLDMVRYQQIAAGASWEDEYGSIDKPAEAAFLRRISPYANLKKGAVYPEPYIWTTTKDDRVGPQHARKFAARMKEYGMPYFFYEDTAGGHSGDADIAQRAKLDALQMTYFAQKLMGPSTASQTAAK